jgi:hypothetical protein
MSDWISVDQKLPEVAGEYIVYPGWFGKPYFHSFMKYDNSWHHSSVSAGWQSAPVTHWMPIPAAPTESEATK